MTKYRIENGLTKLLKIQHPVILAGMNAVSGAGLASAVSNAGGLGVVGGLGWTPKFMREELADLKSQLNSPDLPFGVDLALPKVGGGARKTNHDYTHGTLPELIEYMAKRKVQGRFKEIFEAEDKNRDGVISFEEFSGPKRQRQPAENVSSRLC